MESEETNKILELTETILNSELKFKLRQIATLRVRDNLTPAELNILEKYTRDIEAIHQKQSGKNPQGLQPINEREFSGLIEVTTYLQEQGWKVKKSTIYNHSKQTTLINGQPIKKLSPNTSGKYPLSVVEKYAHANLQRYNIPQDTSKDPDSNPEQKFLEMIHSENLQTSARLKKAQAEHWEKRNRDIDDEVKRMVGQELAIRARYFRLNLTNFFHAQAVPLITAAEGNPTKVPEFIEFCIEAIESFLAPFSEETQFQLHTVPMDQQQIDHDNADLEDELTEDTIE